MKRHNNSPKNGFELPRSLAIVYSEVKREYFPTYDQYLTEKDAYKDAKLIQKHLENMGMKVFLFPGDSDLPLNIKKHKPDIVVNLVDSVKGNEYLSSTIPGVLELSDISYTGAGVLGMSLDHNKFLIKNLFHQAGVPTPTYQIINSSSDPINPMLRYPLISKLNEIHGAVEINKEAVSENEKHLRDRLKMLISTYQQPVLVEEFIVGREVTAILLEGLNKKVYLAEKVFNKKTKGKDKYIFTTFEDQWVENIEDVFYYQKYNDPILKEYVKKAFDITKMADYGKFDIRIDSSGRYYFIDSNCNPAFGPKEADCAISYILDLYGITFTEILKRLIQNTLRDSKGKEKLPITS